MDIRGNRKYEKETYKKRSVCDKVVLFALTAENNHCHNRC